MNNYKLLPALVSILNTRNLTESARELNVTQSAMSKTLGQIRLAFNDKILIREANQFVLTSRGEELKSQLPLLLQQLDNLYVPDVMEPGRCQRKFTFASSDYVAQAIFPLICRQMALDAPNASIEYELWRKEGLSALAESPLDLISTITASIPENLYGKRMAEDQLVVLFRTSHPLTEGEVSIDRYTSGHHIVVSGGGDKDSPIDRALATIGKQRNVFAKVPFFQSAIELLLTTDTLLTTPLHIAADFAQHHDLQVRALPLSLEPHHYYLLWHAKHHQDPEHKWFREMCFPILSEHLSRTITSGMKLLHANK